MRIGGDGAPARRVRAVASVVALQQQQQQQQQQQHAAGVRSSAQSSPVTAAGSVSRMRTPSTIARPHDGERLRAHVGQDDKSKRRDAEGERRGRVAVLFRGHRRACEVHGLSCGCRLVEQLRISDV